MEVGYSSRRAANIGLEPRWCRVVDRRKPDRRDAEVDQVGEPGAYTGEIASVIGMRVTAVDHFLTRGQFVIGGVAVGEAVDHD